jgi:ATP-binding cassette subfamily B protein
MNLRKPTAGQAISAYMLARPWLLAGAVAATLAGGVAEVAFPWLLHQGIDTVVGASPAWPLAEVGWVMLAVVLAIVACHGATLVCETRMLASGSFDLRRRIYARIETLPYDALSTHSSGGLAFRATHDVALLEGLIGQLFGEGLFDLLVAGGAFAAMAATNLLLALIVVAVMAAASLVSNRAGQRLPVYRRAEQMLGARLAGKLQEALAGVKTVRALRAGGVFLARMDADNRMVRRLGMSAGLVRSCITPLWNFAEALGIVVVLAYGGALVQGHIISIGALVAFIAYQQLLAGPINRAGEYVYVAQSCRGVAGRVDDLLAPAEPAAVSAPPQHAGQIVLENVRLTYPGAERPILDGVSVVIGAGEHVALIGRNGAGKSSLFDLLTGLRPPSEGAIQMGGASGHEPPLVGIMLQDTFLFRGDLADNLRLARPDASEEELVAALAAAGGAAFLARLSDGLHSDVGERGQRLSGGERQLVGLARLILQDPSIVLLDEPTAHLDGAARATIVEAIARFCERRTLLLISHDPDLLSLVGRAIVLEAGAIVDDGAPAELAVRSPVFAELMGQPTVLQGPAR